MAHWFTYLEYGFYGAMLLFIVPLRLDKEKDNNEDSFINYIQRFNKTYENDTVYNLRLEAFKNNLDTIQTLNQNRSNGSAYYDLTKFSDLLPEEFLKDHLSNYSHNNKNIIEDEDSNESQDKYYSKRSTKDVPKKMDWREKNVVTKVRNQYQCGACWAFSAIETIESMNAIKNGKLVDLSVQQMIDCSAFNKGCDGGDTCSLLQWMHLSKVKVTTEKNYPLLLTTNQCKKNDSLDGVQLDEFKCEDLVGNEEVMLELIALVGPITVAVNARTWQNYAGGIIQFHCDGDPSNLNHAVQIVGYDLTGEIPHYIARNTWGEDFGDNGYLYIAIGDNLCGVANEVAALKVL